MPTIAAVLKLNIIIISLFNTTIVFYTVLFTGVFKARHSDSLHL